MPAAQVRPSGAKATLSTFPTFQSYWRTSAPATASQNVTTEFVDVDARRVLFGWNASRRMSFVNFSLCRSDRLGTSYTQIVVFRPTAKVVPPADRTDGLMPWSLGVSSPTRFPV